VSLLISIKNVGHVPNQTGEIRQDNRNNQNQHPPPPTVMLPKLQEQSTQPGQQMFKAAA
jgi:hypothetical protein